MVNSRKRTFIQYDHMVKISRKGGPRIPESRGIDLKVCFIIFNYVCLFVPGFVHMCAGTHRGQKRGWVPWNWSFR